VVFDLNQTKKSLGKSPNKYGTAKRSVAASGRESASASAIGGQIEYAQQVFKDSAILQGKLQNQTNINEGLRRELFQKQLENEDLR